jgi:hypothetical protein
VTFHDVPCAYPERWTAITSLSWIPKEKKEQIKKQRIFGDIFKKIIF